VVTVGQDQDHPWFCGRVEVLAVPGHERRERPQHLVLRLVAAVHPPEADRRLVVDGEVGVDVVGPLDEAEGPRRKRVADLPRQQRRQVLGLAQRLAGQALALHDAGLADQQRLAWRLGQQPVPEQRVVVPPGVHRREVHSVMVQQRARPVVEPTFVLADGDRGRRPCLPHRRGHLLDPAGKRILGEMAVLPGPVGPVLLEHVALGEVLERRQADLLCGNQPPPGADGLLPGLAVLLLQPLQECLLLEQVTVRATLPELFRIRERWLVDEVPEDLLGVSEPRRHRRHVGALAFHRPRIQVGVLATEGLRQEREEREHHRDLVPPGREVVGLQGAQERFVDDVGLQGDLPPRRPDAGAHEVDVQ
jgi:hypothetical protein